MSIDLPTIQIAIMIITVAISILSFVRSGSATSASQSREMGKIEAKLDALNCKIDNLMSESHDVEKGYIENKNHLSSVDEKIKTLYEQKRHTDTFEHNIEERVRKLEQQK